MIAVELHVRFDHEKVLTVRELADDTADVPRALEAARDSMLILLARNHNGDSQ